MDIHAQVALTDASGKKLNYAELEADISFVTQKLEAHGIREQSRVAIILEKSFEAVVCILAVRRLSAVYVPIDIHSPADRIRKIINDCQPDLIIHNGYLRENVIAELTIPNAGKVSISSLQHEGHSVSDLTNNMKNEKLAYILYTSGSTGIPKGVCVSEFAADAFVNWCITTFSINSTEQIASIAPFHFDLSICDIHASYRSKSTLHLFKSNEVNNIRLIREELHKKEISFIYSTPTFLSALINYGKIDKLNWSSLRKVLFAGEVFPIQPLHKLMQLWNQAAFYNLYGPTETNVCTYHQIKFDTNQIQPYPIGKPCPEHEFIIEEDGELVIGGPHVAQGYLNAGEELNSRFFKKGTTMWFRTGDLVESDTDGLLHYIGRKDRMIKRRGFRIEPGEIEIAAMGIDGVRKSACISSKNKFDEQRIYLFIEGSFSGDELEFKKSLLLHLPDYMLPDEIILNSTIPVTSTGKSDLQSLLNSLRT